MMESSIASLIRLSPHVQLIQQISPYTNVYDDTPVSPLRARENTQHVRNMLPHSHPEQKRWKNPGGWGARHLNDTAPFTLWDEQNHKFRHPSRKDWTWIRSKFGEGTVYISGWLICMETDSPPQPIPLTLGTMPVIFVRPGESFMEPIPSSGYSNPRVPDPCPTVRWPRLTNPTKSQTVAVLTAIAPLARVRAAIFLPAWTVFELEFGDGQNYEKQSLPGVVAGRTALYHHGDEPFSSAMGSLTRPRFIDPCQVSAPGAAPQDDSNYLQRSVLTPGCRIESDFKPPGTPNEFTSAATTCGIRIRNLAGEETLTIANHGSLSSEEVYHPSVNGGDLIGEVVDARPELDIALVKLTPAASSNFTNSCYFQAEPPTRLLEMSQISQGSWSEVDGMSSGLFSMMNIGTQTMQPKRPAGHPELDFEEWDTRSVGFLFGNVDRAISDGVCGAPIVDIESGGVFGFFHLSDGVFAYSAVLDDLVAEGWGLV
ncbi:hypothetical protein PITC_072800 [Penicillium italicum]|uniref:Uncharacterized protein n=1 Tax=Penicillium italicum TaxID=40296 RepID=A0A0A2KNT7_PENIT|nr:hypothetical protein PITC_072800 [Penicillium italicum]